MKLYLDDERKAPPGWIQCRWPKEVIAFLEREEVSEISLDHDLSHEKITGMDVLVWLEDQVLNHGFTPPKINIHTANNAAGYRMEQAKNNIERFANARKNKAG